MKKILSVILVLAMCCVLIPASAEDAPLAGTWYLTKGLNGEQELCVVNPEAITVTLNEDGTALLTVAAYNVSRECTWTSDGSVLTLETGVEGEEPVTMTVEGDALVFSLGTSTAYLSRTPAEPFTLPGAAAAESAEAFDGTWIPYAQVAMGLYYPMSEAEIAAATVPVIANGTITVHYSGDDGQLIPANVYEGTFADGVLTVEDHSLDGMVSMGGEAVDGTTYMTLSLLEDGSLRYDTVSVMGSFSFFYARLEEAAE